MIFAGWRSRPILALAFGLAQPVGAATSAPLPALAADENTVTVSGLSSGGYMAVQFQVAFSKIVRGAGVIAGGPYHCAEALTTRALQNCMAPNASAPVPTLAQMNAAVDAADRAGRIDPPQFLDDDRVWLLSGGADQTVARPVMDALASFYQARLPAAAVRYQKPKGVGHAMPSVVDPEANDCASSNPPFINRCADADGPRPLDAAGELLAHLSPTPLAPTAASVPVAAIFDQRPYVAGKPVDASLADSAYVYVPASCRVGGCRIHVAFHGCRQNADLVDRRFVDGAGYNRWAESNRLIVLYPQTVARYGFALGSWAWRYNPKACWDWWGYTGSDYATQSGKQLAAVRAMIRQLAAPLAR